MQQGSLQRKARKHGPEVWQFRWSERGQDGKRICRKRVIGTVERYRDSDTARHAVAGLVTEINSNDRWVKRSLMTVAQLCDHFEQRELTGDNIWRSYATKKIYKAYLRRWIVPHWGQCQLSDIRDHSGRIMASQFGGG